MAGSGMTAVDVSNTRLFPSVRNVPSIPDPTPKSDVEYVRDTLDHVHGMRYNISG